MRVGIKDGYFDWLASLVLPPRQKSYKKLLRYLFETDFYCLIPMDDNRAEDGISLRYRYGIENRIDQREIATYLDDHLCSVLEMMVALAKRLEDDIMWEPELGDRTSEWFWRMINNLGLEFADDRKFDISKVGQIIERFLSRQYRYDGLGGLFCVKNPRKDLRDVEIWYQANWYLRDIAKESEV